MGEMINFQLVVKSIFLLICLFYSQYSTSQSPALKGTWRPEKYVMQDSEELPVTGQIFFSDKNWQVLFFVLDENGDPVRASAEGGDYILKLEKLTFYHLFNYSGEDQNAPSRLKVFNQETRREESCRIKLVGEDLTIYFPSGNSMIFKKISD